MKVYRVIIEPDEEWYVARALEDPSVFTQGRTLDEVTENIREVADLLHGQKDVQVELIVPPAVKPKTPPARKRRVPSRR